jgi:hypothetical protein
MELISSIFEAMQRYRLGGGIFGILTKTSGDTKGLDVNAHSTEEGASIIQYNYSAAVNQKWIFELVR